MIGRVGVLRILAGPEEWCPNGSAPATQQCMDCPYKRHRGAEGLSRACPPFCWTELEQEPATAAQTILEHTRTIKPVGSKEHRPTTTMATWATTQPGVGLFSVVREKAT
ncbi:hypothetical protein NDU88_004809 [Pleurodeles waltl]|uniref:Uncharacterized protein n=1 Tax=Pleurodeles waltl TaxID=8319 RepID=A0AAV7NKH9_PLEWA|nr:hypothetical protein NDU88_004809 [Pleurodeles waltl]